MNQIAFADFVIVFRKQFSFQNGRHARRISRYYTKDNHEQHLKNSHWAIMAFIHCGKKHGFKEEVLIKELKIKKKLYLFLEEELERILCEDYDDKKLHSKLLSKIGLVNNAVRLHVLFKQTGLI